METKRTEKTNEKNKMGMQQRVKQGKAEWRKRNCEVNANRNSKQRGKDVVTGWQVSNAWWFQRLAEPEGSVEQDPGNTIRGCMFPRGCAEQDPGSTG